MECPACLGTCAGSCKICKGACGSGAAAPGLSGHPQAPKGIALPGLFRWHLEMGHPLDALIESEDDKKVVFNLFWSPTQAVVNKLNKEFLTWRFRTDGRMEAQRGDDFEKDAEKMIASLEGSKKN